MATPIAVTVNRGLTNSRFDGYRLGIDGAPTVEGSLRLPGQIDVVRATAAGQFAYQKLRRRAAHNHLVRSPHLPGFVFFVDGMGTLCYVGDGDGGVSRLFQAPPPSGNAVDFEQPSIVILAPDVIAFSTGDERLFLLRLRSPLDALTDSTMSDGAPLTQVTEAGSLVARASELTVSNDATRPFVLLGGIARDQETLLLCSMAVTRDDPTGAGRPAKTAFAMHVLAVDASCTESFLHEGVP